MILFVVNAADENRRRGEVIKNYELGIKNCELEKERIEKFLAIYLSIYEKISKCVEDTLGVFDFLSKFISITYSNFILNDSYNPK